MTPLKKLRDLYGLTEQDMLRLGVDFEGSEVLNTEGQAFFAQGRLEEALDRFGRAAELYRQGWAAVGNKACVLMHLGRWEDALGCIDQVLERNPMTSRFWGAKGTALLALHRSSEALPCFQKALEIDPNDGAALFNQADCYEALGRSAEALTSYRKFLALDPQLQAETVDFAKRRIDKLTAKLEPRVDARQKDVCRYCGNVQPGDGMGWDPISRCLACGKVLAFSPNMWTVVGASGVTQNRP